MLVFRPTAVLSSKWQICSSAVVSCVPNQASRLVTRSLKLVADPWHKGGEKCNGWDFGLKGSGLVRLSNACKTAGGSLKTNRTLISSYCYGRVERGESKTSSLGSFIALDAPWQRHSPQILQLFFYKCVNYDWKIGILSWPVVWSYLC